MAGLLQVFVVSVPVAAPGLSVKISDVAHFPNAPLEELPLRGMYKILIFNLFI